MTQAAQYYLLALALLAAPMYSQDVAQVANDHARESDDFIVEVRPRIIAAGETAVLHWTIKGATKVIIEESSKSSRTLRKIGTFGGSGSLPIRPKEDTTYVISCEGSTTYSCASVSVRVRIKHR